MFVIFQGSQSQREVTKMTAKNMLSRLLKYNLPILATYCKKRIDVIREPVEL